MASTQPEIFLSSYMVSQGNLIFIRLTVKNGEVPQVIWMNKEVYLTPDNPGSVWLGFLTADLMVHPGTYRALVSISPSGYKKQIEIAVNAKDYGERRLTLPTRMVDLDAETLERVNKESKAMSRIWESPPWDPLWIGAFLRPIQGDIIGPFGRRSIINNQPRAPHSGVDLKADRGTPVKAANHGRVVLADDHFFSGRTIVIDHGGGIQSMYFHLEKISVRRDEVVSKGQTIGQVGSSGRATGPHLHWGIRINGARIDPMNLILLSQDLEGHPLLINREE